MPAKAEGLDRGPDGWKVPPENLGTTILIDLVSRYVEELKNIPELARDIRDKGQLMPCGVTRTDAAGIYRLIHGRRRLAAAQWSVDHPEEFPDGPIKLWVRLMSADEVKQEELHFSENIQREGYTWMDLAAAAACLEQRGRSAEEIKALIRVSAADVPWLLKIAVQPKPVRDALHYGKIKLSAAKALCRLGEPEKSAKLALLLGGKVNGADLAADQRAARRATGKPVAWTMKDVHLELAKIDTAPAADLLAILSGKLADPDGSKLRAILAE